MAISVFPELMDRLDPEDVDTSLRTIESYIHYIVERVEFSLTNNFKTVNNLGVTGEALSLVVSEAINDLSALTSTVAGKVDKVEGKGLSTNDYTDEDKAALANKVDKETGKGLSENDYTNTDKTKLAGVEAGAQVNVIEIVRRNGAALTVTDKAVDVSVPTQVSQLTNDSGFQTAQQVQTAVAAGVGPLLIAEAYGPAAVVSFDGTGDDLPLKSCAADIKPVQAGSGDPSPGNVRAISGWTRAKVHVTGKNLFDSDVILQASDWAKNGGEYSGPNDKFYLAFDKDRNPTGLFGKNMALGQVSISFWAKGTNAGRNLYVFVYYTDGTSESIWTEGTAYRKYTITTNQQKTIDVIYGSYSNGGTSWIKDFQIEIGGTVTDYEPFGRTMEVSFPSAAGTVYGGTLDVIAGVLTVTHGQIASYAGETLPGAWISDRDVYAPGTSPSTGAQVVYELASPVTYQITPQVVTALAGTNNIWADCGDVTVEYGAFLAALQAEIDGLDNRETAIEAVLTNAGPILYENVQDVYVETGQTSVMSVKALGAVTYKWEHFWNSWTQPNWEGKDTDTLHIPAATSQMNLRQVRCTITGSGWTIYSRVAYIHVA